jgi:hypothetical protein
VLLNVKVCGTYSYTVLLRVKGVELFTIRQTYIILTFINIKNQLQNKTLHLIQTEHLLSVTSDVAVLIYLI